LNGLDVQKDQSPINDVLAEARRGSRDCRWVIHELRMNWMHVKITDSKPSALPRQDALETAGAKE